MAKNRTCVICNTKYDYCPTCSGDKDKPSWYASFHEENCNNIYDACVGFRDGILTKTEAEEKLNDCNLSNMENFRNSAKEMIKKILTKETIKVEPVVIEELKLETKENNVEADIDIKEPAKMVSKFNKRK